MEGRDYYLDDLRMMEEFEEAENIRPIRKIKFYKIRANPLETLLEEEFKDKYRFSRRTAVNIVNLSRDDLAGDSRGGHIPPYLQVLTAIRVWARGQVQSDAGDLSGISQPKVSIISQKTAVALARLRPRFVKMPTTIESQNKAIWDFHNIARFRQVIGAIDCTHIRIPNVGGDIGQYYINKKGYISLNVQVVCNSKHEINDIVARWRGNTHDSRIFNESSLKVRFENQEFQGMLLGDSGYACIPYLFTPVLNSTTEKQEGYNRAHILTRNVVERCFGVWKQRFRCLLHGFTTSLENIKVSIVALAILHNIATHDDDPIEIIYAAVENVIEDIHYLPGNIRGNAVRAAFIENNF